MKKLICTLAVLISFQFSYSQDTILTRDLESWNTLGISKKIGKHFKVNLNQQFRFDDNSTHLAKYFTNLSADYKFNKHFSASLGYRFIREKDEEENLFENQQRWNFDATYKHKLDRLSLSYRLRLQTRNDWGVTKAEGDESVNYMRLRLKAGYNIKNWKLDPYFTSEIFRKNKESISPTFNNLRFTLGTSYKIKGFGNVGGFYRIERELGTTYPKTTYIIGLKLKYNL